jgi:transcriptional regulator with XRE-family HTH domain
MPGKQDQRSFADELELVLVETDTSIRRLARLSGIPRRSLENWLYGRTPRPRSAEPILHIASTLHLPASETDKLLIAAGYPSLGALIAQDQQIPAQLLADWQLAPNQLLGQKSAAISTQHNLPAEVTPFIGREDAVEKLGAFVRRPDLRLITITGLGGVGKTRLAQETARSLVNRFDHGVYFIPLDNIHDKEGFWEAIIKGLHIPIDAVNSPRQIVEDYLRNKQVLLLLDNFEHLLDLSDEIGRLLSKYPRLNLLITSRHALDLQAEQLYPLEGLSTAEGQNSAAYRLYLATASRRIPGYTPTGQEAQDIIALCKTVEGLPLALELAATWSDVLSPRQILEHLKNDMNEVWHQADDRPHRQRSLWDLFNYSWNMLPTEEQDAAMRLSVLHGSFISEIALSLADCPSSILKHLTQASFIMRTSGSRLMIHRLVRGFLTQQAGRAGYSVSDLEERFMETMLRWTSDQARLLLKTFHVKYLRSLQAEWQHIERAWWLAVEQQRYDLLEACWDIIVYFEARGIWRQGMSFFKATAQRVPAEERRMQALLDEAESVFSARLSDIPGSLKLARRSLRTFEELGIDATQGEVGAYARVILYTSKYALNQRAATEEVQLGFKKITGEYLAKSAEVIVAQTDGVKLFAEGNPAGAAAKFEGALNLIGPDAFMTPTFQCFLGIALRGQGLESAAREQFSRALQYGLLMDVYPAVVTATYELSLLEQDNTTTQKSRVALEKLALEMGSRRTVGQVAIINAIQYLNMGLVKRGTQLSRIGLGMMWNDVDNTERRRVISSIVQAYIAFGLVKTAPQLLSLLVSENQT